MEGGTWDNAFLFHDSVSSRGYAESFLCIRKFYSLVLPPRYGIWIVQNVLTPGGPDPYLVPRNPEPLDCSITGSTLFRQLTSLWYVESVSCAFIIFSGFSPTSWDGGGRCVSLGIGKCA